MDKSTPFLQAKANVSRFGNCAICNNIIVKKKDGHQLTNGGWTKIKEWASLWMKLRIPDDDKLAYYSKVYDRIQAVNVPGSVHENCRKQLLFKYSKYKKYGDNSTSTLVSSTDINTTSIETSISDLIAAEDNDVTNILSSPCTRSLVSSRTEEKNCFICDADKNEKTFRISKVRVSDETSASKDIHLNNPNSAYHLAAKRLDLLLSGQSHDIYAADIYYHNHCLV